MPAPPLSLIAGLLVLAAPTADRFPKPDPAGVYAEYKIYRPPGDPLRRPAEDWEGARRRLDADPAWARFVASRREEIDDWMARRRDHVEWAAGWYHDFEALERPEEPLAFAEGGIVISRRLHTMCEAGDCLMQIAEPIGG